jgi:hypothetical protein
MHSRPRARNSGDDLALYRRKVAGVHNVRLQPDALEFSRKGSLTTIHLLLEALEEWLR